MHRQGIRSAELSAGTIVLGYVLTAVLWFALSDRVLGALVSDPGTLVTVSTLKGWAFVAATGTMLAIMYGVAATKWAVSWADPEGPDRAIGEVVLGEEVGASRPKGCAPGGGAARAVDQRGGTPLAGSPAG